MPYLYHHHHQHRSFHLYHKQHIFCFHILFSSPDYSEDIEYITFIDILAEVFWCLICTNTYFFIDTNFSLSGVWCDPLYQATTDWCFLQPLASFIIDVMCNIILSFPATLYKSQRSRVLTGRVIWLAFVIGKGVHYYLFQVLFLHISLLFSVTT